MNTLVLEDTSQGEQPVDVYQRLASDRILFLTNFVDDQVATDLIATLLLKDHESSEEKITLFINCNGGDIRNVLMLYDVMQMITAPIETICIGSAMDEAAILLAAGTKGMRLATENSVITVSQLVQDWHTATNITDGKNLMEQFVADNNRVMNILSKATGKTIKQVKMDFDRRVFFKPLKAAKYGIIDYIITPCK
jgi:ATP-dependent Clp protease, protease subunit